MVFQNLLQLNALEILVIWAGFAVATGIGKVIVRAIRESNDIRAGRQKTCGPCNFTIVTNEYSITTQIMDEHNERVHDGKPAEWTK